MRRLAMLLVLASTVIATTGCVIVLGVEDLPPHRRVVEIDGELYFVGLDFERIHKIESAHVDPEEEDAASGSQAGE